MLTLIFTQGTQQKGNFIINDIIESNKTITLKSCDSKLPIKFFIYKKDSLMYSGDFSPYNETKWISSTQNPTHPKKKNESLNTVNDPLRIKLKCQYLYQYHIDTETSSNAKISVTSNRTIKLYKSKKRRKASLHQGGTPNRKFKSINLAQATERPIERKVSKFLFEQRSNSKPINNKLTHNKSCEGGIWGQLLPNKRNANDENNQSTNILYNNSMINETNDNLKKNKNDYINTIHTISSGNYSNSPKTTFKKHKSKNNKFKQNNNINNLPQMLTNSSVKEPVNKNNTIKNGVNEMNKLDEKFKKFEESIIDKNFEKGIECDEIIVSVSKKLTDNFIQEEDIHKRKGSYEIEMRKGINILSDINNQSFEEREFGLIGENTDEENEEFENLKGDFNIFYTNDYMKSIEEEMLLLELQLMIEKIFELQKVYHKQLDKLRKVNIGMRKIFNFYSEKYVNLNKRLLKLKQKKERAQLLNSLYTFVDNHKLKNEKEITQINKTECKIWKILLSKKSKNKDNKKEVMYNIFEKVCGDNIYKLDNAEQMISSKLLNKIWKYKALKQQHHNDINVTKGKTKKSGSYPNVTNKLSFTGKGISNKNPQASSSSKHYNFSKYHKSKK